MLFLHCQILRRMRVWHETAGPWAYWVYLEYRGEQMKLWRCCVLGYLGGMLYTGLELLWRGWSHGSMFLAGGICFLLIGHLGTVVQPLPVVWRGCVGAVIVTMVELAAGLLVNREYGVWDYRGVPGNFLGQICLPYTLLWIPVSLAAIMLYDTLHRALFGGTRFRYRWI